MIIQTVDLASVCWASYLGERGRTPTQFSAADYPDERSAVEAITSKFQSFGDYPHFRPGILIIEEMPHAVAYGEGVKNTIRMQGRIIERMDTFGHLDRILFVQPMAWQSDLGANRKTPKEQAEIAAKLGYTPPDLVSIHGATFKDLHGPARTKVRDRLKKLMEDHVSAFLIYAWAEMMIMQGRSFDDIKSAQRYHR